MNKKTHKIYKKYKYFSYIDKASEKKINICTLYKFCVFFYSFIFERTHLKLAFLMYIYIYIYIYIVYIYS